VSEAGRNKQRTIAARKTAQLRSAARRLAQGSGGVVLVGMTDATRLPDPLAALDALPRGEALIWRSYGERPIAAAMQHVARVARAKGCLLLLAGEPGPARRLGVDGLHLPERFLKRPYRESYGIVTAAAHSEAAVHEAARAGANAILISPVFPTASHPGAPALGILKFAVLARLARSLGMAPYALGGITTADDVKRLTGTGAAGIAGIGFLQA
jgi:thiamine monophosphate synthase